MSAQKVQEIIKYSDGTETIINYTIPTMEENTEVTATEATIEVGEASGTAEETVETPTEETPAESETA